MVVVAVAGPVEWSESGEDIETSSLMFNQLRLNGFIGEFRGDAISCQV